MDRHGFPLVENTRQDLPVLSLGVTGTLEWGRGRKCWCDKLLVLAPKTGKIKVFITKDKRGRAVGVNRMNKGGWKWHCRNWKPRIAGGCGFFQHYKPVDGVPHPPNIPGQMAEYLNVQQMRECGMLLKVQGQESVSKPKSVSSKPKKVHDPKGLRCINK